MKRLLTLFVLSAVLVGFTFQGTDEPAGKTVFVNSKCGTCHSVESAGLTSKAKKNVDLSETGKTYNKEFLAKYLTKKEKINDKNHGASFKGSDEELAQLTDWLASLKEKK